MIGKKTLFLTVGLVLMVTAAFGAVTITDTGAKEAPVKDHNYSRVTRLVTFNNNGPVSYRIYYSYINDPELTKENPNAVLPWIGDSTAGTTGLGVSSPWYSNGCLGVEINGKSLTRTLAKEFKVVEEGKRGVYDVTWSPEWADIRARFVSMPDDDKLYLEVSIDPRVQVSSIRLKFACIPGLGLHKHDQWISTAERSVQHRPEMVILETKKEPWVIYYDTQNASAGACALVYVPEEASDARVDISANVTGYTYISYPTSTRKMRFVLCNFPEKYKNRDESFRFLKENGNDILTDLKKFDFGK